MQFEDITEYPKDLIPELVENPTVVKPQQGLDGSASAFHIPPPQCVLGSTYGNARRAYPSMMVAKEYLERHLLADDTPGYVAILSDNTAPGIGIVRDIDTHIKKEPGEETGTPDYDNPYWWKAYAVGEYMRSPLVFWFPRTPLLGGDLVDTEAHDGTLSTPQGWAVDLARHQWEDGDDHYMQGACAEMMTADISLFRAFSSYSGQQDYPVKVWSPVLRPDEYPGSVLDDRPDTYSGEKKGMTSVSIFDEETLYKKGKYKWRDDVYEPFVDKFGGSPYRHEAGQWSQVRPFDTWGVGVRLGILGVGEGRAFELWANPHCDYTIEYGGSWTPLQD